MARSKPKACKPTAPKIDFGIPTFESGTIAGAVAAGKLLLIFTKSFTRAQEIAKRHHLPRSGWRFVTSVADTDGLSPLEVITVTEPGYQKNIQALAAHKDLVVRAQVNGTKIRSFDP